jgi:protoporphyrinogen oxidase
MKPRVVIIGAGVTGLAAGMAIENSIIIEKEDTPGGTAKSFCFKGYWFDNTVHFLLIKNSIKRLESILKNDFKYSELIVWVETLKGTVRYPFQLNLGGLDKETQKKCVLDFDDAYNTNGSDSYRDYLLNTFGREMCNVFFFPYNEKCWKYPLEDMTSIGQVWNIHKPTKEEIIEGIINPNQTRGRFNTEGYYPVPDRNSPIRGIKILSDRMAEKTNLNLSCRVIAIDTENKYVRTMRGMFEYEKCLSTIPLPALIRLCNPPESLMKDVLKLRWNKMLSVAISIEGDRPTNTGHYRYYTDPDILFNKLTYMTEFDMYAAPDNGFGILLEVKEPDESVRPMLMYNIISQLYSLGILNDKNKVVDINTWEVNPAYVIFTKETPLIVSNCKEYLESVGITTLGRYGSWEYSSMAENIEDGFNYADSL